MNSAASCHEIVGCPGLYVDAFRGRFAAKTQDPSCSFILTHYHGDHYSGLPRDGRYQGPALIHCTPVTAALLRTVHKVPSMFVREHNYGISFSTTTCGKDARVTFLDANHCPGAAIVFIELTDGTCHLHTGDMRYHEKMKAYPLLKNAAENRNLELLYLDTTYGHPKHEFLAQDDAVDTIASQVHDLLGTKRHEKEATLVLLSCYSIGKEKVLWEASMRSNQLVHVSETKFQMLQCIEKHQEMDVSSRIIERCTLDPSQSDLHVIPMGMAGELWPYFQPKFRECAEYAQNLEKQYQRVVAFLPTGWAVGSNWNKKNAVSTQEIECEGRSITVEIRLVSYSEHSAFSELCSFVEYLRPRKVVPTVFSDAKDCRRIEGLFRNMIDATRAKKQFFKSMSRLPSSRQMDTNNENSDNQKPDAKSPKHVRLASSAAECSYYEVSDVEIVLDTEEDKASNLAKDRKRKHAMASDEASTLVSMGFDNEAAKIALERNDNNVALALDALLSNETDLSEPNLHEAKPKAQSPPITRYFSPKKR